MLTEMISDALVFFSEARAMSGLPPIAGAALTGPPVAGIDFVAPLICDPRNIAKAVVSTAGSRFAQGLPEEGKSFDWRDKIKLSPVGQQGKCGSCWAFAVAGSLSDRQAVMTGSNPNLSPVEMIACTKECQPICGMCSPLQGFSYANKYGIPGGEDKKQCLRLVNSPNCSAAKTCSEGRPRVFAAADALTATSIDQIKKEIFARGPVCAVYRVFRDFVVGSDPKRGKAAFDETDGVYVHVDLHSSAYAPPNSSEKTVKSLGDLIGYHAVVIVGWGVQDVRNVPGGSGKDILPYWIVRNSWGEEWGDKGYFKCAISSGRVNQTVAMDLPISVRTKSEDSKYGGVFFSSVQAVHGASLNFWTRPNNSPASFVLFVVGASLVLLLVVITTTILMLPS